MNDGPSEEATPLVDRYVMAEKLGDMADEDAEGVMAAKAGVKPKK